MKVVNKWNRRLLRAVRRTGGSTGRDSHEIEPSGSDDHSIGSNDGDVRVTDSSGNITRTLPRRTRESIMQALPRQGQLSQQSRQHLDFLYALAYPNREKEAIAQANKKRSKLEGDTKIDEDLPGSSVDVGPGETEA